MDTIIELLPVLLFLLFGLYNYFFEKKEDDQTQNKRGQEHRRNSDAEAARAMIENLKKRNRKQQDDLPQTLGGIKLMRDEDLAKESAASKIDKVYTQSNPDELAESIDYISRLKKVQDSDAYKMPVANAFGDPHTWVHETDEEDVFELPESADVKKLGEGLGLDLESRDGLRKAFIVAEIISKPLSLRGKDERISVW